MSLSLYNTLTRTGGAVHARARRRAHVRLRAHRLQPRPRRQLPDVRGRGPAAPRPALQGYGHPRHEHHRRGRPHHQPGARRRARTSPASPRHIQSFREDMATLRLERPRATCRARPTTSPRWSLIDRLHRARPRLHGDGSVYFRISTFPEYGRLSRLERPGHQGRRARGHGQIRQGAPGDFALWKASDEPVGAVGRAVRPRTARMAHRVLGHEHEVPRARRSTSTAAAWT